MESYNKIRAKIEENMQYEKMFVLSTPRTENQIQFLCMLIRDGLWCKITQLRVDIIFSGDDEWRHYAERWGMEPVF